MLLFDNVDMMAKHSLHMWLYYQIPPLFFYVMTLIYLSVKEMLHRVIILLTFSSAFFVPIIYLPVLSVCATLFILNIDCKIKEGDIFRDELQPE